MAVDQPDVHAFDRRAARSSGSGLLDRAAGAWTGGAAAACMVGAPSATVAAAAAVDMPPGAVQDAAHTARAVADALELVRFGAVPDDAAPDTAADSAAQGGDAAFAAALQGAVASGVLPAAADPAGRGPLPKGLRAVVEAVPQRAEPERGVFPCGAYVDAVWRAHAAGGDAAAIAAGALAGARWGVSGLPRPALRRMADIVDPRSLTVRGVVAVQGPAASGRWPSAPERASVASVIDEPFAVAHPHDSGVVLGNLGLLRTRPDVDAVVSLNPLGPEETAAWLPVRDRVEMWLEDVHGANANLHFVLDQAAGAVAELRAEGKRVLLHCAAGQSRTPAVAAHYAARSSGTGIADALRAAIAATGGHLDNPELARAAAALHGLALSDPAAELFPAGAPLRRDDWPA